MKFEKSILYHMNMPYAVGTVGKGRSPGVVCATEDHGPVARVDAPYREGHEYVPGPGGCMSLLADPDVPSSLYAIMGCFVGYKFQGAGVYLVDAPGAARRLFDLPFAHRLGIVRRGDTRWLLAANLAADKKDAADWSSPGAVWAAELPRRGAPAELSPRPVLDGIHKNHGFLVAPFEGRESVLIGCAEGLLSIAADAPSPSWPSRTVLPQEVSEIAVFDLDGDGQDELVTIEPFHGSQLRAYRRSSNGWGVFWETEISFGHCVLAGNIAGRPSVLVSNRSGSKDLLLFQFSAGAAPTRVVVEAGAAAANMLVLPFEGKDRIFSANQAAGELVMYTPADA